MRTPETLIDHVAKLISRGGPEPAEFFDLLTVFDEINAQKDCIAPIAGQLIKESDGAFNSLNTMQGHVCQSPYGYYGDFHIIDRIYNNDISLDPSLAKWDEFFHWGTAAVAVRNRKTFFLTHYIPRIMGSDDPMRLLNVGSGPCRDVAELLLKIGGTPITIDCVDADHRGFDYAKDVVGLSDDRVNFIQKNALRLNGPARYDMIWSAGLFDYLDDKLFVALTRRLGRLLLPKGEIVIGNFSNLNTQMGYMAFGGWNLRHRSAEDLLSLSIRAGFEPACCEVLQEPTGVNLFLHVRLP